MAQQLALENWLTSAVRAFGTVAETNLHTRTSPCAQAGESFGLEGATVSVDIEHQQFQIGILSSVVGCKALTRSLLRLEDGDHVTNEDVDDAIGEIANIVAGMVVQDLEEQDLHGAVLGTPEAVHSAIPTSGANSCSVQVALDNINVTVVVLK